MFKEKILLNSTLASLLGLSLLCTSAVADSNIPELAQGDGDPAEVLPELPIETTLPTEPVLAEQNTKESISEESEPIVENELKQDEQFETAEDAVATITAEGDFVVPTYLLPIEPATSAQDINDDEVEVVTTTVETITMPVLSQNASLAASKKIVVPVLKTQEEVLSQINEGNGLNKIKEQEEVKVEIDEEPLSDNAVIEDEKSLAAPKKPLLLPLAPIKELKKDDIGQVDPRPQRRIIPSDYADQVVAALERNEKVPFIMPQEVKVTFYPNAVDFSGQTVKWIRAFSLAALSDPRLVVDVRISTQNPEIQAKRLPLVQNVLLSNGLSPHQIQITYADRPSDTLILRNIIKPEAYETVKTKGIRTKKTKKW